MYNEKQAKYTHGKCSIIIKDNTEEEFRPNRSVNEFVGQLIDIFEDFLDSKNIKLENDEKEDNDDAECVANIYGSDYGILQNDLDEIPLLYYL